MSDQSKLEKLNIEEPFANLASDFWKEPSPYLQVLLALAGIPITSDSRVRSYGECPYSTSEGFVCHNPSSGATLAHLCGYMHLILLVKPCEAHLPRYLELGWKEI